MCKNIIICCDGTGNQLGEHNSNVVKLFRILEKDPKRQIAFYDPGLGTMSDPNMITPIGKKISKLFGLAFGHGLQQNVEDAYRYLMDHYEKGDKVYLFGFSRGAYTVRVLAGLIFKCGLLEKGSQNLIPYAYKLYKKKSKKDNNSNRVSNTFRKTYAREVKIHFLGLWDTVNSVGWLYGRSRLQFSTNNPNINIVRHALAIDERRAYYRQNQWGLRYASEQDIKQVWFAGVHSDVGGSYCESQSGLSKICLEWMVEQAMAEYTMAEETKGCKLKVNTDEFERIVLGKESAGKTSDYVKPDHTAELHPSLKGIWWIGEFLPKNRATKRFRFYFPRGKPRKIPEDALIHQSVFDRIKEVDNYKPLNLPDEHLVEPKTTR